MKGKLTDDFTKVWAALSVSLVGSEITALALPLFAAIVLDASPLEMGVLVACGQLPFLLCSIPAGILADRVRRRPIMVGADLGAGLLLLTIPVSVPLGGPAYVHLCAVAFGVGTCAVLAEVAHYAYVPTLVGRERLTAFNSRLQVSYSVSESAGPGIAGVLVQTITAPFAVLVDAISFLFSAAVLGSIRKREPPPPAEAKEVSLRRSLADGLRVLMSNRLLRPIIIAGLFVAAFENGVIALYVLYATRELGLEAATIGAIFIAGGLGAIPGAMLATRAGKKFGIGRAIIAGLLIAATAGLLVPLAGGSTLLVIAMLATAKAVGALAFTVANIHQWSLRQAITPDHLAGRVTAAQRFIVYGGGSLGAIGGGALGGTIGLQPALFVCAIGAILAPLIIAFSPVRHLREQPASPDAAEEAVAEVEPDREPEPVAAV